MFTDKEAKKIIQLLKNDYSENSPMFYVLESIKEKFQQLTGQNIDFLNIGFPSWLPNNVKKVFEDYIQLVKSYKENKVSRIFFDFYSYGTKYLITISPVITSQLMEELWLSLNKISPEKTERFARELLGIENDFGGGLRLYFKHKEEKNCFEKILKKTEELQDLMEEYECHFYGHMVTDDFFNLQKNIDTFKEASTKELENFEQETKDISYLFSDLYPITREFKKDKALPIFFARKISLFLQKEFEKPFNKDVADMVNLMFKTEYIDNDIIKMTKPMKKFIKGENSPCIE